MQYHVVTPIRRFDRMPGEKVAHISGGWPSGLDETIEQARIRRFELIDCDDEVLRKLAHWADSIVDLSMSPRLNRVKDWSLLRTFSNLQWLSVSEIPTLTLIDFTALPYLHYLECNCRTLEGLEKATSLRELSVTCRARDFSWFAPLQELEELILESSVPESVAGIGRLELPQGSAPRGWKDRNTCRPRGSVQTGDLTLAGAEAPHFDRGGR